MNYNQLSDRKLNLLVAVRAMGWQLSDRGFYVRGVNQPESYSTPDNWNPATDIAAAWELVDKYRLVVRPTVTDQWCAAVLNSGQGRIGCFTISETYTEADTATRAICLTALKAWEMAAAAQGEEE